MSDGYVIIPRTKSAETYSLNLKIPNGSMVGKPNPNRIHGTNGIFTYMKTINMNEM